MQTEPEQWAVELLEQVDRSRAFACPYVCEESKINAAAALTIQRAFEEQTRELREKLARYEQGAGPDDWRQCPGQCGESCCGYHDACRRALATRQDAPVTENSHDH